jgi:aryl-alcohol dehydrogenase-like predicted oxidoreductase
MSESTGSPVDRDADARSGQTDDRVTLGPNGPRIRPLGIGTWAWGDRLLWGYGGTYRESDLRGAFDAAVASGITLFDTAEVYGNGMSERILGRCVRQSGADVLLATKFLPYPWRLRRSDLLRALESSRGRLGVSTVDLYQMHWPFPPVPIDSWMAAMAEAVRAWMTRAVGVSNYDVAQMRRAHAALARFGLPLATNQVEYSLLQRKPETSGLFDACRELGVTLIAYSPLAMGLLTGKYTPEHPPSGLRGRRSRDTLPRLGPLTALLKEIGDARGKTPAQVSLNWVIGKGAVPIPGAKNADQARSNASALGWKLDAAEVAELERTADRVRTGD